MGSVPMWFAARESYIYDKREGVQIMRILLVCVVSVLLFIFVIVGSPMYVNFYGSDASLAYLSMSRVITLIACFMPLFLLAQLIVSALCRLMSSAGSKGGKFLSLEQSRLASKSKARRLPPVRHARSGAKTTRGRLSLATAST